MPILIPAMYVPKLAMGRSQQFASGDVVISGLGFRPKYILFIASGGPGTYTVGSHGWSNGSDHRCFEHRGTSLTYTYNGGYCISCYRDGSNYIYAVVSALSADGFTLTFTRIGNEDADYMWLAIA